jgi:hypothetical protein
MLPWVDSQAQHFAVPISVRFAFSGGAPSLFTAHAASLCFRKRNASIVGQW